MKRSPPARIHLLPAKAAPYVVVFRRKPTDWTHLLRWNTETDQIEQGAWHFGTLYPKRSDVSFDGQWMVFLALGNKGDTWNGISRPPSLETVFEDTGFGTYQGGGYWEEPDYLRLNGWGPGYKYSPKLAAPQDIAARIESYDEELGDQGVLYRRLARDGWVRCGENYGQVTELQTSEYALECIGDDGWKNQPTANHPTLRMQYTGYRHGTLQFKFWLEEMPDLIDEKADWACWDSLGQLIYSSAGVLYKYKLCDLLTGQATSVIDLEYLSPPGLKQ